MSLKKTWHYGLSLPKGYVDNSGKFTYQIPDEFRILLPSDFLMGWSIYKGGLNTFVKEGYLCPESAKKFAKIHRKHKIEDDVKIVEYNLDEKTVIGDRWAVVIVKSTSGWKGDSYTITYSRLPKKDDDPNKIIKSLSRMKVMHQCDKVARRNLTSVPYEAFRKWFPDISYNQFVERIQKSGNVEFDLMDSHEIAGWIYVANKSPFMADLGVLNEKNLEKMNPEFRHMNRGVNKLSELDSCCQDLFQTIGFTELLNKFRDIWIEETST
jgi:hypothetical protein